MYVSDASKSGEDAEEETRSKGGLWRNDTVGKLHLLSHLGGVISYVLGSVWFAMCRIPVISTSKCQNGFFLAYIDLGAMHPHSCNANHIRDGKQFRKDMLDV